MAKDREIDNLNKAYREKFLRLQGEYAKELRVILFGENSFDRRVEFVRSVAFKKLSELNRVYWDKFLWLQEEYIDELSIILVNKKLLGGEVTRTRDNTHGRLYIVRADDEEEAGSLRKAFLRVGLRYLTTVDEVREPDFQPPLPVEYIRLHKIGEFAEYRKNV